MEKKTFVLIDGNSLMNRAFYAINGFTTKDGFPTNAIFGFVKFIFKILEEEKPDYLGVAFDLHAPTFRHKMFKEYKGTRTPTPEALIMQFPALKEVLRAMRIRYVELQGYEADDIIGTLSRAYEGVSSVIYTGDRDAYQLVNENVTVCFTKRGVTETDRLTSENFFEKMGLTPAQIIEEKALMGDSSDNIPGVPGIGPKTALSLLQKYGTAEGVYEHLDELAAGVKNRLIAGRESARLSHTLATIDTHVPLSIPVEEFAVRLPFSAEARAALDKLEFRSLVHSSLFEEYEKSDAETVTLPDFSAFQAAFDQADCFSFAEDGEGAAHVCIGSTEYIFPCKKTLLDPGYFPEEIAKLFAPLFAGNKRAVVADYKALLHRFAPAPVSCAVEDVGLLSYLLNSGRKAATAEDFAREYALPPSNCAYALMRAFKDALRTADEDSMRLYRELELPLSRVLFEMEETGVRVDEEKFPEFSARYASEMETLTKRIYALAGCEFNLNSSMKLSEVLFEKLGYSTKGVKKTARGDYSTNAEVLEQLAGEHEIARLILRYREIQKLRSTYIDGIRPLIKEGIVHTTYNQTMTTTGRLSSANPNLQNIPVRREEGRELRKLFIAREGNVLVDADYSQIELRLLAHFSGAKLLRKAYHEGKDIHAATASLIFKVPPEKVTPELRRRAKAVNFGIIYGISAYGLSKDVGCSASEAQSYIDGYFATYPEVREYMDENVRRAREDGYVTTILGRKRYMPELRSSSYTTRSFGERAAMNMPLQGSSADIIKLAMLAVRRRLQEEGLHAKLVLQVHDELILDTPEEEADRTAAVLKEEMEGAVKLEVPLIADVSTGRSWYDAK